MSNLCLVHADIVVVQLLTMVADAKPVVRLPQIFVLLEIMSQDHTGRWRTYYRTLSSHNISFRSELVQEEEHNI